MTHRTPVQRLGITANLVIFLGILYALLHCMALLGLLHGYRLPGLGLVIALSIVGLGYGIRYGSRACLYAASGSQRLDPLAPLPRSPADAAPATRRGVSTTHESLRRALSASLPPSTV